MECVINLTTSCIQHRRLVLVTSISTIISDDQRHVFALVNYVILCGSVSVFGIATNVINLVVFYRQGLSTTTNIGFFALAVSDLCSLIIQQLFNVFINPRFLELHLSLMYTEIQHLTGCVPRALFSRISCLITVYMTAERCLCVAFPLHIKQIITLRRTKTIMCLLFVLTLMSASPLYAADYLGWKFYPHLNQTLIGMVSTGFDEKGITIAYFMHSLSGLISFMAVVFFTSVLIVKLKEKTIWRQSANAKTVETETMSSRDRKTMTMVAVIAGILIVCYTPSTLLAVTTVWEPEFSIEGYYYNFFYVMWSIASLMENINASVNMFLYLKMSSKYRQTFHELFN